ncbi:PP2C family serine/threonine-protein phosphatase [Streptomyces sp. ST2-7A]|uniref:PP2C family protein-serine/threonine phosphatase n=1 Tax=Streptomyces sp. ST2-7A TaxID=2907214 RepID=UPI001F2594D9|nr:PP2C family serine/threonine-protein phosphatase [Streptomyces sp. ST2-7A]MCE7080681.1 protein phosphatase 2C domain-containing protein [Streptomyces sp. ST2-7A]
MSLALRFAAGSHTGMIRDHNEDSGYAGPRLLAVADGMGGQAAGEVASSEVISSLVQLDDDIPGSDILTSLDTSAQRANARLRGMVEEDPRLDGMGTTLTALLWTGRRLGLVHIGDSRAYLLRDGLLTQITQDHTWVQRLVDEGRITEEEAGTHPQRSLLMRALGSADQVEADLSIREVRTGDRYLLCSDGLSGVVSHETLQQTLGSFAPPPETVRELIDLALRGGGPDNITCIVADVLDTGHGEGDTLATQLNDAPQIVGAVAEVRPNHPEPGGGGTPAARAAELNRPAGDGRNDEDDVLGSFGDEYREPRPRRRWWKRGMLLVLVLGLVGAAAWAGWRWTQEQYFVGANGDHVAVFRGVSQDLGPLSLNSVHRDHPEIALECLPEYQRGLVENAIPARDLREAEEKIAELGEDTATCREDAEAGDAPTEDPGTDPTDDPDAEESTTEPEGPDDPDSPAQPTGTPDTADAAGAPDRVPARAGS